MANKIINKNKYTITIKCDVCGSIRKKLFMDVGEHKYVECKKCKTIYLITRELNFGKKRRNTYLEDLELYLSRINPHGTRYIAGNIDHAYNTKILKPRGKLLEIGSGMGHLSYTLFSRDWEVSCLELSEEARDWAFKTFKLPVEATRIEDYKSSEEETFDAFVMVEVIEHLYNPLEALQKIKNLASEKALIFGTTPNTSSKHWVDSEQDIYQPHDHIVLFNSESLRILLEKAGLKDISIDFFGTGSKNDSNLMYSAVVEKSIEE